MNSVRTTRIAGNTLALCFRQILIMLVSHYTVRVVPTAEDCGIYNAAAVDRQRSNYERDD